MLHGAALDTSPAAMLRLSKRHLLVPGEVQPYDFLVVIDFEATCEADRAQQDPQEIIEFPAVLVSTREACAVDEFHSIVKPTRRPLLSAFCTQLTGITQDMVDAAPEFPAVMRQFLAWLAARGLDSNQLTGPSFIMVTHGDWDLREMLPKQMELCDLSGDEEHDAACLRRWINLNPLFDAAFAVTPGCLPRTASGVESMAVHLQMQMQGRLHCGIDDTRNIARIVAKMLRFDIRFTPVQAACHRCGLPGHFLRDCPHAAALGPPPVPLPAQSGANAAGPSSTAAGDPAVAAVMTPNAVFHGHQAQPTIPGLPVPPMNVVRRPGDWFCQSCGALNFAKRVECYQCGAARRTMS